MSHPELDPQRRRSLSFEPTPAVAASRARSRFIECAVCQVDNAQYLFHKKGVRFVRCRGCGAVYVNPLPETRVSHFDIDAIGQFKNAGERALCLRDFEAFLETIEAEYLRAEEGPLTKTLLLGRFLRDFAALPAGVRVGLDVAPIDEAAYQALATAGDVSWASALIAKKPQVVILHELLEACSDPAAVLEKLTRELPTSTWFVVTYTNSQSLPARLMRRYWPAYFDRKTAYFNTGNLTTMLARFGLVMAKQFAFPVTATFEYVARRLAPETRVETALRRTPLGRITTPLRAGNRAAIFRSSHVTGATVEKLSIVMPVFNEARYCAQIIEAVLAKPLKIEKEVIVVESNSTDGTREIVRSFEGRTGVKVIYEDRPRGKGHAVRTGLAAVTGTIILIQDADFEYDIDDYDALLEPILQRRATFVLGSRSLGLDDWKVRRLANHRAKALSMNTAQMVFAWTYNVLYQQKVTDVNTMFKVFRRECIDPLDLESDGFELDIELACKLARNGNSPMEVPVNYVARGFDEGKKISFIRDSFPSYFAFFRHRFK